MNFKNSRRRRGNHFHNYQAKSQHLFNFHFLLQDICRPIHLQILLLSHLQHYQLGPKLHHPLHLQVHPSVAHVFVLLPGHRLSDVDLSTNGPSLCLEALGDGLVLVSDGPLGYGQPIDGQGLNMGTHQPGTGIGFNSDLVHALLHLLVLIVLDPLLDVVMNQFVFKLLHHRRKNQSQPSPRPTNLKDGNLTTNRAGQTNALPTNQLHKQLLNEPNDWQRNADPSKSQLPTLGLFSIGQQASWNDTEICDWA